MSTSTLTCDLPEEIEKNFNKFKFKYSNAKNACMILKCNKKTLTVEEEDTISNTSLDELQDYLPDGAPRFIICSYKIKMKDDRVKVPMALVYYSPPAVSNELNMIYATTKSVLVSRFNMNKVIDISDPEVFTDEFMEAQLR